MSRTQVLRNSGERLQVTFTVDGIATDPDGQVSTVEVTRADGTILQASTGATRLDVGVYTYSLQPQADLDWLTATWTGTFSGIEQSVTTQADVVGGYYVSLAELRSLKNLGSTDKYTRDDLLEARQWFEDTFERHTHRAFVPRYQLLTMSAVPECTLVLPDDDIRRIRSVTVDGTLITVAGGLQQLIRPVGRLTWSGFSSALDSIQIAYEYGRDRPTSDIVEAAKIAIRDKLLTENSGLRELSVQTDIGIVRNSTPGPDRPFGIPSVDKVANDYRRLVLA
jgi:hypothetical protein